MTLDLKTKKDQAEDFLSSQIEKLDPDQKEKLSYVLLGATLGESLIGKTNQNSE